MNMNKEEYARLVDNQDKQTAMLMSIQIDVAREISLLKLAHQKLKYINCAPAYIPIELIRNMATTTPEILFIGFQSAK